MNHWKAFDSLPTTNEGWGELARQITTDVQEGNVSGLQAKVFFTRIQRTLDVLKDVVDAAARDEAETYGQKEFEACGAKVQLRETGVVYDYSRSGHPVYNRLKEEVKPVLDEIKTIEKSLQSIKTMQIITDPATGETAEVYPPEKRSKSIVVVTPL